MFATFSKAYSDAGALTASAPARVRLFGAFARLAGSLFRTSWGVDAAETTSADMQEARRDVYRLVSAQLRASRSAATLAGLPGGPSYPSSTFLDGRYDLRY